MPTHFGWFTDRDEEVTNEELPFIDDGDMVSVVGSPIPVGTWTDTEDSNDDDVMVVQMSPLYPWIFYRGLRMLSIPDQNPSLLHPLPSREVSFPT